MKPLLGWLLLTGLIIGGGGLCLPDRACAAQAVIQVAQAGEETGEAPAAETNETRKKASGFMEKVTGFFDGLVSWIKNTVQSLTGKVDSVFGFEKGEGPLAFFGTMFYVFILLVLLFVLVFVFNIIKDMFASMFSRGQPKPPTRRRR